MIAGFCLGEQATTPPADVLEDERLGEASPTPRRMLVLEPGQVQGWLTRLFQEQAICVLNKLLDSPLAKRLVRAASSAAAIDVSF